MSLDKGDIVLVPFPFTDLSQTKLRPAVVLHVDSTGNDITVCFISSQAVTNLSLEEFAINPSEPEFTGTGLRIASKVRVSRIVTLEKSLVTRRIGKLGINQIQQLNNILIYTFQL
jgi:mRNA interferase MazF